jgi:hypothetical protein
MNDQDRARVLSAIAEQGPDSHATLSGPILTILTDFATAGKLREFAEAFRLFQKVRPPNGEFVREQIPGKILNYYLLKAGDIDVKTFDNWSASDARKEWAEQLKNAASNSALFEAIVNKMRDESTAAQKKTAA